MHRVGPGGRRTRLPGADPSAWREVARAGEATPVDLALAAAGCRACALWRRGTQTVFGAGSVDAQIVLVGEQPGDREDRAGRPFVGPAGRLLDAALEEAGIDRSRVYVTNVVKHFKWKPAGKRRIHEKPSGNEVRACKPWLEAELAAIAPEAVICLGATACQALLGSGFRVTQHRGELVAAPLAPVVLATVHPAWILRLRGEDERARERARFVDDLRRVKQALRSRIP